MEHGHRQWIDLENRQEILLCQRLQVPRRSTRQFDCEGAHQVLTADDCVHDGSRATDSARNVGQDQESNQEIIPLEDGRLAAFNLFVDQMK